MNGGSTMFEKYVIYLNGDFVPWDQATVHVMTHGVGRGSVIFEVLRLENDGYRTVVFRLDEHVRRLFRSAGFLNLELSLTPKDIYHAVIETVKRNDVREGFIKIVAFSSSISFDILPPGEKLDVAVMVVEESDYSTTPRDVCESGSTLCISTWKKIEADMVPVQAKVSANYLNGMMARMEARDRGFDYAVMLDSQGYVAEGGTESVFLVKNGTLVTPSLDTILPGITRKSILEVGRAHGVHVVEGKVTPGMLVAADELFLSGTMKKILPIRQIEDRHINGMPGPLTRRLAACMDDVVAGRDELFKDWLVPVR
jgi:branched-chain amino acid aminotransferase